MPVFDLSNPTQLLFQWGWLLVTRANAVMLLLVVLVLVLGATVSLPERAGRRRGSRDRSGS